MDFTTLADEISDMNAELEAARQKHLELLKGKFKSIIRAFFEKMPTVQAVAWNQYTPYFNDGDPCVFGVNEPVFITKNFDETDLMDAWSYEDDDEYGSYSAWSRPKEGDPNFDFEAACYEFGKVIQGNSELMEELFGDHVTVYLTKEKVISEEYDHD